MALNEKWYFEVLNGTTRPHGTPAATLYPSSFNFNKKLNQKQGWSATFDYDASLAIGKYLYIRHQSNPSDIWLYGRIESLSTNYEDPNGQSVNVSGYCNIEQLSEINVGKLALFDFDYRDPYRIKQIRSSLAESFEEDRTLPISWQAKSFNGSDTITNTEDGIDAYYFGSLTPFNAVQMTITTAMSANSPYGAGTFNYDAFRIQYLNGELGWTDALIRDFKGSNFTGTDETNALSTTGTDLDILFVTDPAGTWIKSSQSGESLFWLRMWYYEETAPATSSATAVITDVKLNTRIPTPDAITRIMALATGWAATNTTTADWVYHEAAGESVTEMFGLMSKMTGGVWYNASNGTNNVIGWLPEVVPATDITIGNASFTFSDALGNIEGLWGKDVTTAATRFTLYGAGHGQRRLTAELEDISGTLLSGTGFTYDSVNNILINGTAETALGYAIHKEINIPYTSSLYSSGESIQASNQILKIGYRLLKRASRTDREAYTIKVMNLSEDIDLGTIVRVTYDNGALTLDQAFMVTEIKGQYSANTPTSAFTLELSDDGYSIDNLTGSVSIEIAETRDKTRYRQPIWSGDVDGTAGGGSATAGDNLGTHIATKNLDMGGFDITNVGDVDGVDVSQLKADFDTHEADETNPHNVTAAQIGALTSPVAFSDVESVNQNTLAGRIASGSGPLTDLSASQVRTIINVEDGANNYSHPAHSGDVVSIGDGVTTLQASVISGKAVITAVSGDYLLIWDATDSALKRVNASAFLGGGYTHPNHSGDVTSVGDGVTTIAADAVTYAKMQNMTTARMLGRTTAGTGIIEELTAATVRTFLNVSDGANAYTHPNHSGDVTSSGDGATTIGANKVTLAKIQTITTARFLGRNTAGTGNVEQLTAATARTMLNVADGANNYSHPNHSGEVTSSGDGAMTLHKTAITNRSSATPTGSDTFLFSDASDSNNLKEGPLDNLINPNTTNNTVTNPDTVLKSDASGRVIIDQLAVGASFTPTAPLSAKATANNTDVIEVFNSSGNVIGALRADSSGNGQYLFYSSSSIVLGGMYSIGGDGYLELRDSSGTVRFSVRGNSTVQLTAALPTSDPGVSDRLYANNGVVVVSGFSGDAIGATDWQSVSLHSDISGTWTTSSPGVWGELRYRKLNTNQLEIQGSIKRSSGDGFGAPDTVGGRVFTASVGYRPSETRVKTCYMYDAGATDGGYRDAILSIGTDGVVTVHSVWDAAESLIIDTIVSL